MSNVPAELLYTSDHEWVSALTDEGTVRIGITDHAQDALGDVVYVDLPSIRPWSTASLTGRAGSLSCALQTLMISLVCSLLRHTKQSWTRVSTMV